VLDRSSGVRAVSFTGEVTTPLAEFAATPGVGRGPTDARQCAAAALGLGVSAALSATDDDDDDATRIALTTLQSLQTADLPGSGRPDRLGPTATLMVNAIAMRRSLPDFRATRVAAAALAVAGCCGSDAVELTAAVAIELEVADRLTAALGRGQADRGWDVVSTTGRIAPLRRVGFSACQPDRMVGCRALPVDPPPLLLRFRRRMTYAFQAGKAAASAVEGILLAQQPFSGVARPIEGRGGLALTFM